MNKPSSKKQEIYEYIVRFTEDRGYPPSVREIGEAVGLRSPSTVHSHLQTLRRQGLINMGEGKTRTISTSYSGAGVPIMGKVAAGEPIFAFEEDCGRLAYRAEHPSDCFALKVRGDSMVNAGILDGDYVVVRRRTDTFHNAIVVALLDDEATVKRLSLDGGRVSLLAENPNYEPIDGEGCLILGRVIAVVREL
ncbi:MAG: transcriptional repressor LexA [Oscillospiraceae bacterium]|jgi:repressor LexA|nr:transcriptional repressor LexA [Oscillospiraceae bacterium]